MVNLSKTIRNEHNGFETEKLRSFCEKVTVNVIGACDTGHKVNLIIYIYDENDKESIYFNETINEIDGYSFNFSYTFDPINLSVYNNAQSFKLEVRPEEGFKGYGLTVFSVRENAQARAEGNVGEIVSNIKLDENGNKVAEVYREGGNITVPIIPKKAVFVGNSILLGMHNRYGMCASAPDKDYYYYVTEEIKKHNPDCEFHKIHGAPFERCENKEDFDNWYYKENSQTGLPGACEYFTSDVDLIVIQLTDNVNSPANNKAFSENLEPLILRLKKDCPNARILWVYGWYLSPSQENLNLLIGTCNKYMVELIDICYLRCKANEAKLGQKYLDENNEWSTINDLWVTHPGDDGMKKIADRILMQIGIK